MKDVFISYNHQDKAAKNELTQLFDREGISYFSDVNDLPVGEDIETQLKKHLRETKFTVMLVSKNSLFSTWVGMEAINRLQQDSFNETTSFLPILIDKEILDIRFPITMAKVFKAKQTELETLRDELRELGQRTEIYDVEINRISRIDVSDILSKIRNSLSCDFTNEARKPKDLEKLIHTIKNPKTETSANSQNNNNQANSNTPSTQETKNIIQNAEKIYNIEKIDKADFS